MAEIFASHEQATPRELAERFASAFGLPDLARAQLLRIIELAGSGASPSAPAPTKQETTE